MFLAVLELALKKKIKKRLKLETTINTLNKKIFRDG